MQPTAAARTDRPAKWSRARWLRRRNRQHGRRTERVKLNERLRANRARAQQYLQQLQAGERKPCGLAEFLRFRQWGESA